MDILYFLKEGASKCDDFELRCSLRSIEKYGRNVGKVYIVGHCPDWLSDEVIKIPYMVDPKKKKHKNLHSQLLYAIRNSDIGVRDNGEFLVSMDDHFYCRLVDFDNYPYYVKGEDILQWKEEAENKVRGLANPRSIEWYENIMISTHNLCKRYNLPTHMSTIHRNMHMNRYELERMSELNDYIISDDTPEVEGFCLALNYRKSYTDIKFDLVEDIKVRNPEDFFTQYRDPAKKIHVFSTRDFKKCDPLYILLKKIYNNKSKYERYE